MRSITLDIYQGDDYLAIANISYQGLPINLSLYTPTAQIRRSAADTDATVDATLACEVVGSTIHLSLTHAETLPLSGDYVWDLQLSEISSGNILTIAHGPVHVTPEVTRP